MTTTTFSYPQLGLEIIEDFITEQEEKDLVAQFTPSEIKFHPKGRRSIKRYGDAFPYGNFISGRILPDYLKVLADKLVERGIVSEPPRSATISEYAPWDFCAPHIDNEESGEIIISLSLLSSAEMVFAKEGEGFAVQLPPRSLVVMQGKVRTLWTHEIPPVSALRYSIVFRNAKK